MKHMVGDIVRIKSREWYEKKQKWKLSLYERKNFCLWNV